jgi:hypothetical protein
VTSHVCVPPVPHAWLAAGVQTPCPAQVDHADHVPLLHVRLCVPQLPHACVDAPVHVWPVHGSHWHATLQFCVPPVPHAWLVAGVQTPSPAHVDHADHVPLLHVRFCDPHLPHACVVGPAHVWPVHGSHWQVALQACVPAEPHDSVVDGVQTPSPVQADHADHVPLLQVRDCDPHLPHACVEGPAHV